MWTLSGTTMGENHPMTSPALLGAEREECTDSLTKINTPFLLLPFRSRKKPRFITPLKISTDTPENQGIQPQSAVRVPLMEVNIRFTHLITYLSSSSQKRDSRRVVCRGMLLINMSFYHDLILVEFLVK
ncbi:hypothetical protein SFRURICE_005815 [Spodoptera frugiperda]|nr:hypothetical protein SFRURICE_005815 [Spodoptera frugiperda]